MAAAEGGNGSGLHRTAANEAQPGDAVPLGALLRQRTGVVVQQVQRLLQASLSALKNESDASEKQKNNEKWVVKGDGTVCRTGSDFTT